MSAGSSWLATIQSCENCCVPFMARLRFATASLMGGLSRGNVRNAIVWLRPRCTIFCPVVACSRSKMNLRRWGQGRWPTCRLEQSSRWRIQGQVSWSSCVWWIRHGSRRTKMCWSSRGIRSAFRARTPRRPPASFVVREAQGASTASDFGALSRAVASLALIPTAAMDATTR